MGDALRSRLPVDGFYRPCVSRLHCAYEYPFTSFQSYLTTLQRLIYAFIYYRDKPGGPEGYLTNISIPGNVAKVFLHTLNVRGHRFYRTSV